MLSWSSPAEASRALLEHLRSLLPRLDNPPDHTTLLVVGTTGLLASVVVGNSVMQWRGRRVQQSDDTSPSSPITRAF
ncbi:MAG: hypothetical protein Q8P67_13255 [archaeon]|nr:hypothetical protein [archaeon]